MTPATSERGWAQAPPPGGDRSKYPWCDIVSELRQSPEQWAPMLEDVPVSLRVAINAKTISAFRMNDGEVKVRVRDSYVPGGGKPSRGNPRRGTLWMAFIPNQRGEVDPT